MKLLVLALGEGNNHSLPTSGPQCTHHESNPPAITVDRLAQISEHYELEPGDRIRVVKSATIEESSHDHQIITRDGIEWELKKIDSTHFSMKSKGSSGSGKAWHVAQFQQMDSEFYAELVKWLHRDEPIEGKVFEESREAQRKPLSEKTLRVAADVAPEVEEVLAKSLGADAFMRKKIGAKVKFILDQDDYESVARLLEPYL